MLAALLLVASSACGPAMAAEASPFESGRTARQVAPAPDLAIEVRNGHWNSVTVWVHWPGMRHFLGDARPGTVTTFRIPADLVRRHDTLRLYAADSGSIDETVTRPIEVEGGHVIEWRITKVLANSRTRVR